MESVFKVIGGEICISVQGITKSLGISEESALETVKKGMLRNKDNGKSWIHFSDEKDNRKKWVVVNSIPKSTQNRIHYFYGDITQFHCAEKWISIINTMILPADGVWYLTQKCTETKAKEYARACAWLRFTDSNIDVDKYTTMQERYETIIAVLKQDKGHCLRVTNWRSLRNKVVAFSKDGRASLISGKNGNDNSKKVTDLGVSFILNAYASPLHPSVRDVARLYSEYAHLHNWKPLSEERIRQIVKDKSVQQEITLGRDGKKYTKDMFERTIKRRPAPFPDALWSLDGTTLQLMYLDAKGKTCSDLYFVAVMDVYSDRILGYALGETETSVLVQQALRSAIRNTMMKPLQLQYDNSSANKSKECTELFKRMATWGFPTAPHNGKSKPIEPLLGRFEGGNMRHMPNFKGGNITSHSREIKANPDFLTSQKLADLATTIEQFGLMVDIHNNTKGERDGKTPMERYRLANEHRIEMDYLSMVSAFWVERKEGARYTKDGLTIEVNKQRYTYEVETERGIEDMEFRMNWIGTKFTVKYDPDDLEYISLWFEDKHVTEARQKWLAPMAVIDNQEGDMTIVRKALKERTRYINVLEDKIMKYKEDVLEGNLPAELSHYILNKDAYNRIEQKMINDEISSSAMRMIGYPDKKKKPNNFLLYGDEPGSMAVLED